MVNKKIFLIKNFKDIVWHFEEKKIAKILKSNYQIQNITLSDLCTIYLMSTSRFKLINKSCPVVYNSLKGNTIKKTIQYNH